MTNQNLKNDGVSASECLWTQPELEQSLRYIESDYSRLLSVRADSHPFGYIQTKARFTKDILDNCKDLAEKAGMVGLTDETCYQTAYQYADWLTNARKHYRISPKDSENYLIMLDYLYDVFQALRRHIRR